MAWLSLLLLLGMLLALFGLCVVLVRRTRLDAALAPLAALALLLLLLLAAGMADVLRPAALALAALGLAGGAAETVLARRNGRPCPVRAALAAPGAKIFWLLALALALRLAWLQPEFTDFDEYSFWGMAAKLTSLNGRLYTVCESGVPWQMTQFAALPLASYFFQLFGAFAAWRAIFAADLLMLAALAAVVAAAGRRGWRVSGPLALAALLLPTALSVSGHTAALDQTWLDFMGDLPAGVLFGEAAAFWLAVRGQKGPVRWLTLPVLLLAGNIKSNTFVLALAAAGLIALDAVLFRAEDETPGLAGLARRAGFGLACLAAPAAQYLIWNRYTAALVQANAQSGGMGDTTNVSLPSVVVNGFKMLRGGIAENYFEWHREEFWAYKAAMEQAFFQRSVSVFGSGAAVCLVIGTVFLAAVLLAPGWRQRLRVALWAAGSAACFAGYWLMLLFSYAFVLKDSTPDNMASYSRYFGSYYTGWLLLALAMLACQCAAARRPLPARLAALAAGLAFALPVLVLVEPQYTVLGASRGEYAAVRAEKAVAAQAMQYLEPDDRVFLIYQGDTGAYWFMYAEALLPYQLVYGAGGGTYGTPSLGAGIDYFQSYSWEDFSVLIQREKVDYLLVVRSDNVFAQSYSRLFTDGLAAAQAGPVLYRVTDAGYTPAWQLTGEEAGA